MNNSDFKTGIFIIFTCLLSILFFATCGLSINSEMEEALRQQEIQDILDEDLFEVQIAYTEYEDGEEYTFSDVYDSVSPSVPVSIINNSSSRTVSIDSVSVSNTDEFFLTTASLADNISAGGSSAFSMRYFPLALGEATATLTISYTVSGYDFSYTLDLSGTRIDVPVPDPAEIQISDPDTNYLISGYSTYDIGEDPSDPVSAVFTIENTGEEDLHIWSIITSNSLYTITDSPAAAYALPGGATVTFTIELPDASTPTDTTMTIVTDADNYPSFTFDIVGGGSLPPADPPLIQVIDPDNSILSSDAAACDIGEDETDPVTAVFTIENKGDEDLVLYSIVNSNSSFTLTDSPAANYTLAGGETVTFTIELADGSTPADTSVTINTNADNVASFIVNIHGGGELEPAEIQVTDPDTNVLSSDSVSFDVGYDASNPVDTVFTITNTGEADLIIYSVTSSNSDYTFTDVPPAATAVAGGGQDTFTLRLADATVHTDTVVTISTNAATTSTFLLNITGGGALIQHDLSEDIGYLLDDFGYDFGYSASLTTGDLTIENDGPAVINIPEANMTITGADAARYSITNVSSESVSPGSTSVITVSYTPNPAAGSMFSNAVLTIEDEFGRTSEIYLEGSSCEQPDDFSGLSLWLRADRISSDDVGQVLTDYYVNTLPDLAGEGFDASYDGNTGRRPRYIESGMNSRPAIEFDSTDDYLIVDPSLSTNIIDAGDGITSFIVFRTASTETDFSNTYLLYPFDTASTPYGFPRLYLQNWNWDPDGSSPWTNSNWKRLYLYGYPAYRYPEDSTISNGRILADSDYGIAMADDITTSPNGTMYMWINNDENDMGTFANTGAFTSDPTCIQNTHLTRNRAINVLYIGATNTVASVFGGQISEIFFFKNRLIDTDIESLNRYMIEKYNLTEFF